MKIFDFIKLKDFSSNKALFLLFLASFSAITAAYTSQYFFGLKPCILCLYQRIPFFAIIAICVIGFFAQEKLQKLAVSLCLMALLINAAIALYHVGVEQKIFKLTEKCTEETQNFNNTEELQEYLSKQSLARCDEPQFFFLGLSMATWNAIFCLSLIRFISFFYKKHKI